MFPIHDIQVGLVQDKRRTWLRPLETGRCSCGLEIAVSRVTLGEAAARMARCHTDSSYPVIAWRLDYSSPGFGPIGYDIVHHGVDLNGAHLVVTQPENTLWIGLAHHGDSDGRGNSDATGKGEGNGNDDDNGGGDKGDRDPAGDSDGDRSSRNRSRSPPASGKCRTSEAPPGWESNEGIFRVSIALDSQ